MKKQVLIKGRGSAYELHTLLERNRIEKFERVFIVTGKNSYFDSGAASIIEKTFPASRIYRFFGFQINPILEDILKGLEIFKQQTYDLIIAVGGGTAIDVAKAIRFFAAQQADPLSLLQGKAPMLPAADIPFLVIPTTSGSGSEATHFSVVYHNKQKYSLTHYSMLPDYVCIDGDLTLSLSRKIAAYTGLDALCQAIESFWSVNSTVESRNYSKEAVKLILEHIIPSVQECSPESRMAMAEGAHFAGKAINITKTTGAHAFSYYLTTHYGIPHGQAVGMLIDSFILFNANVGEKDISDLRGTGYINDMLSDLYQMLGADSSENAARIIQQLRKELSLEIFMDTLVITDEEKNAFFESVNYERLNNNPRFIDQDGILELRKLFFERKHSSLHKEN
ncbi:MAG: phosphonoacetaldehyde reductase [Spirochaetia bacterium]|nr:phosphonoacetaldehyde reductase [Spirochaetia bacterium]